jgi:hypothetical protein
VIATSVHSRQGGGGIEQGKEQLEMMRRRRWRRREGEVRRRRISVDAFIRSRSLNIRDSAYIGIHIYL